MDSVRLNPNDRQDIIYKLYRYAFHSYTQVVNSSLPRRRNTRILKLYPNQKTSPLHSVLNVSGSNRVRAPICTSPMLLASMWHYLSNHGSTRVTFLPDMPLPKIYRAVFFWQTSNFKSRPIRSTQGQVSDVSEGQTMLKSRCKRDWWRIT